jgi:hypothetical protein
MATCPKLTRLHSLVVGLVSLAVSTVQLGSEAAQFPIATNAQTFFLGASSGSNYLVPLLVSGSNITAQLVATNGSLIGPQIPIGKGNGYPRSALGNTNYLVCWDDDYVISGVHAFGQFISRAGATNGSRFPLTTNSSLGMQSVAFDGTNFLVVLRTDQHFFCGQFVTAAGALSGSEFLISNQQGSSGNPSVAFGTNNYLVVWQSNNGSVGNVEKTYGAFVSTAGSVSSPFQISQTNSLDQNPLVVAFDGTNYLVVWNRDTQLDTNGAPVDFHLYARVVSPAGVFTGNEFTLVADPGNQRFPNVAFGGGNYLLTWMDQPGITNYVLRHRFFNAANQPLGVEFSLNLYPLGGVIFGGQQYLAVGGFSSGASVDVYGAVVPTITTPPRLDVLRPLTNGQFQLRLTGTPGINYAIQAATNALAANTLWTALATNAATNSSFAFDFADPNATNRSRFYRALKP